jgi:hypothetical protein
MLFPFAEIVSCNDVIVVVPPSSGKLPDQETVLPFTVPVYVPEL